MVLTSGFMFPTGEKEAEPKKSNNYQFEGTVLGKGLDNGETYLIALTNLGYGSEIKDGTYYADNLSDEMKVSGLKIRMNCRLPGIDEIQACAILGPAFDHVVVTDCEKQAV